jgi:hypothetical protein
MNQQQKGCKMDITALENGMTTFKEELVKFEAGNKSAATRARKALQEIKQAAQALRGEIQKKKEEAKKAK